MLNNIGTDSSSFNVLEEHASAIKRECRAFHAAGQSRIRRACSPPASM